MIDLLGPGLILLGLALWLVRKVVRAARTEHELEEDRLRAALADHLVDLQARPAPGAPAEPAGRVSDPGRRVSDPGRRGPQPGRRAADLRGPPGEAVDAGGPQLPRPLPQPPAGDLLWLPGASEGARAAQGPRAPREGQAFNALAGADLEGASPEHLALVAALLTERQAVPGSARVEVLWVRSTGSHVAWCERRHPAPAAKLEPHPSLLREVICVAEVEGGKVVARSSFG